MRIIITITVMCYSMFSFCQESYSKLYPHSEGISQEGRHLMLVDSDIVIGSARLCFDEEYYACSELYRCDAFGNVLTVEFIDEFAYGLNECFLQLEDRIIISGTNRRTYDSVIIRHYDENLMMFQENKFSKKADYEGIINRGVTQLGDKLYLQNNAKYPGSQGPVVDNIYIIDNITSLTDTIIEFSQTNWEDKIFDAQEDLDGKLAVLHFSYQPDQPWEQLYIIRLDPNDNYSQEVIPLTSTFHKSNIKNFLILPNGNYVYTQFIDSRHNVVYCVDRNGNPLWNFELEGDGFKQEYIQEMTTLENGDILACGFYKGIYPESPFATDFDYDVDCGWLSRISSDGDLIWRHYYPEFYKDDPWPTSRYSYLYDVEEMADGSIVATGMMSDYDEDDNRYKDDLWLLRVTADGCLEPNDCEDEMQEIKVVSSVDEVEEAMSGYVYPNPTSGEINLSEALMQYERVEIYDSYGCMLMRQSVTKTIDVESLQNGLYIMRFSGKNMETFVSKILMSQ